MDKMDGNGLDLTQRNVEKLKRLFPECVKDGRIDFDILKSLMSSELTEVGEESYGMSWPGKKEVLFASRQPSTCTLRPIKELSSSYDSTKNIYIEGDNLDALKAISKTYHGKVKAIFIDPPYNTGEDRVYHDDFETEEEDYLEKTNQSLKSNPATSGRYHTDWLNLMYPRLKIARELLTEDGAIFISIDDNEVNNMLNLCNEIFYEENFVGLFIWEKKKKPSFLNKNIGKLNDYIVCYTKNNVQSIPFSIETTTVGKKYPFNNAGNPLATLHFPAGTVKFNMEDCEVEPQDMSEGKIITKLLTKLIIRDGVNANDFDLQGEWRYSQDKLNEIISNKEEIVISKIPFRPNHVKAGGEVKKMSNFLTRSHYDMETNEDATEQIISYFGKPVFSNPKPIKLIKSLLKAVTYDDKECIVMDFFSGSGTTADAVMELNAEDGGSRRFVLVQLPEDLDENLTKAKPDEKQTVLNAIEVCDELKQPHLVTNIGEERIRRAAKRIIKMLDDNKADAGLFSNDCYDSSSFDFGFRVYRVDSTNIVPWDGSKQYDESNLLNLNDVFKEGRTKLDVAYEVMLKYGVFDKQLEEKKINGKDVFCVDNDSLVIFLEDEINMDDVKEIIKLNPTTVVFKESGFADDNVKMNAEYTLRHYLGEDQIKVLCI